MKDDLLGSERDSLRSWLTVGLNALQTLRLPLLEGGEGAVEAVLRLAAILHRQAHLYDFADMTDAAAQLEKEPDVQALDELTREIGSLLASPSERSGIFIVHPDEELARKLTSAVSSYADTVHHTTSLADARKLLSTLATAPGAFLIGTELPDGDGRDLLLELRTDPLMVSTPVFMLGRRDSWTVTEALALGALSVFDDPARQVLPIADSVAAVLGFEERMSLEMLFDPLTGVLSAEDFRDAMDRMGEDYSLFRTGPWSLVLVSIDNFDRIDEACGRQVAEDALLSALGLVRDRFPEEAVIGRLRAEQIGVILPETTADSASQLIQQLPAYLPDWSERGKDGASYRGLLRTAGAQVAGAPAREVLREMAQRMARGTPGSPAPVEQVGAERSDLVLLAEDTLPSARLVTLLLERVGLRVVHRVDGAEALQVALTSQDANFALMILDLNLPSMDGFEILRRVRLEKRLSDVPVIMLTSSDTDRHKVHGLEAGADDYITKPFGADVFLARVRSVLRRGRSDAAAVAEQAQEAEDDSEGFEVFEGDAE